MSFTTIGSFEIAGLSLYILGNLVINDVTDDKNTRRDYNLLLSSKKADT